MKHYPFEKIALGRLVRAALVASALSPLCAHADMLAIGSDSPQPAPENVKTPSPLDGLSISGYIDPVYIYNRDADQSSFRFLNEADKSAYNYDNSTFGDLYLNIAKKFASGSKVNIVLMPTRGYGGSLVDAAQFTIPITAELSGFAGKIPAWDGFEGKYSTATYQVTHSLLYDFSEPGYFTGAGGEYTKGIFDLKAMIANSWNSSFNSSIKTPTLVYRFTLSPSKDFSYGLFGTVGDEPTPAGKSSTRYYVDFDGSYTIGKLLLGWQFDYGHQVDAAFNGKTAEWWGALGVANYRFTDLVGATFRYDYLDDSKNGGHIASADFRNGFITDPTDPNKGTKRQSLTAAILLYPTPQLTTKFEYRHDIANLDAFAKNNGALTKHNDLLVTQFVYTF